MSLINQMLRDLEQRQPAPEQPAAIPVMPSIGRLNADAPRWPYWLAGTLGGGVLLVLGYWLWPAHAVVASKVDKVAAEVTSAPVPAMPSPVSQPVPVPVSETPPPLNAPPAVQVVSATPQKAPDAPPPIVQGVPKSSPVPKAPRVQSSPPPTSEQAPLARPKSSKSKNALERLQQQADQAVSLSMRKEIFKDMLALEPANLKTRDQLLGLMLKTSPPEELENFLHESLLLFPKHLAFVTSLARLQLQQKKLAAATQTLLRAETAGSNEPAYLSLLASSYQQQNRFQEAESLYQTLIQLQPEKAEHWLGLGICADNLQQPATALQAYQKALDQRSLSGEVILYIQQRLEALN